MTPAVDSARRSCRLGGRQPDFRPEQHLVTPTARGQRVADALFARAVNIGSVNERYPRIDCALAAFYAITHLYDVLTSDRHT